MAVPHFSFENTRGLSILFIIFSKKQSFSFIDFSLSLFLLLFILNFTDVCSFFCLFWNYFAPFCFVCFPILQ